MTTTERFGNFEESHRIIRALLNGCATVLDLGCGKRYQTQHIPDTVCVDIDPEFATDPRLLVLDIRTAPSVFRRWHFDAVLLGDVIEHLSKEDGAKLLRELEPITDRIILFTPLGELWLSPPDQANSPHQHRSGWMPGDLPGYEAWVWPKFHHFPDGGIAAAFFAWKWINKNAPTPEEISKLAGTTI